MLTLLSALLYGPLVADLSDQHYPTRSAAHDRLRHAGWLAYPALVQGRQSQSLETATRCQSLIAGLPKWRQASDRLVAVLLDSPDPVPELTPEAWLALEAAVVRAAERCGEVEIVLGDRRCVLRSGYGTWVRSRQFWAGSHPGEVRLLCEAVRRSH